MPINICPSCEAAARLEELIYNEYGGPKYFPLDNNAPTRRSVLVNGELLAMTHEIGPDYFTLRPMTQRERRNAYVWAHYKIEPNPTKEPA